MELKDCFKEDFILWLAKSNKFYNSNGLISDKYKHEQLDLLVKESLGEILDVLLREPLANYFWYGYPEYGGKLCYTTPSLEAVAVPGDALKVDKEKIKIFLRDAKIDNILNDRKESDKVD
jgi:hypothetical protein